MHHQKLYLLSYMWEKILLLKILSSFKVKVSKYSHFINLTTTPLLDIGGMLVNSVLKSNQIAQHVVSDVGNKAKQNGTAGRPQNHNSQPVHSDRFVNKSLTESRYFELDLTF